MIKGGWKSRTAVLWEAVFYYGGTMKIIVFEIEEWERNAFDELKKHHDVEFVQEPLRMDNFNFYKDADILSVFIYSKITADLLQNFNHLRLIATRSTGYDHIDVSYCRENGIGVCNVPTYGEVTVAEHVFALLLNISHNISKAVNRTRNGVFSLQGLQGFDLKGKTLGVVGTGNIGRAVIDIAKGYKMHVLAFDINPQHEAAQKTGFSYVPLDELLEKSDIITLHVPAVQATMNFISKEQFRIMKKGVVLINTSRGSVVDTEAMLQALGEKKLAAVGIDVLPQEPLIREEAELLRSIYQNKSNLQALLADHILLNMQNVYITPHSAFYTREGVQRLLDTTVDNIVAFLESKPAHMVVEAKALVNAS